VRKQQILFRSTSLCSEDPEGLWDKVIEIAWKGMEENVRVVVDSRLVQFAEDSHENVRAHFEDSMNVVVVRKCDGLWGLGLVGVHEGRFLATVGRD